MHNKVLLLTFLTGVFYSGTTQTTAQPSIEAALNKASFLSTALPFDEAFVIKGPIPENCFRITYTYEMSPKKKGWMTLLSGKDVWSHTGGGDQFALQCNGLHPNVKYKFDFKIFKQAIVDDKARVDLKKKLTDRLIKFTNDYKTTPFGESELATLNADLNNIFLTQLKIECSGAQLASKCDPDKPYTLDVRNNPLLRPQFEAFGTAQDEINDVENELLPAGGDVPGTVTGELFALRNELLKDIDVVLSGKAKMNPVSKELLAVPFAPSIPDYKGHTLHQGLTVFRKLLVSLPLLTQFLQGNLKIKNTELEEGVGRQYQSIQLMDALVRYLASAVIKDTVNKTEGPRFAVLNNILTPVPPSMVANWDLLLGHFKTHEANKKIVEQLIASFPDFTAEIVLADALSVEHVPIADVVSEKSPYISAEAGLSYSTSFASVVRYAGANFYFTPVNKRAKLSTFRGWDLVKKMFCINVAVANFFGTRPENTYSIFGDGSSQDLLLGAGLRFGRVIKVNAHWLLYKTNNTNTLTNDRDFKGDFLFSFGADVDLLKALGSLGKALNLTN